MLHFCTQESPVTLKTHEIVFVDFIYVLYASIKFSYHIGFRELLQNLWWI